MFVRSVSVWKTKSVIPHTFFHILVFFLISADFCEQNIIRRTILFVRFLRNCFCHSKFLFTTFLRRKWVKLISLLRIVPTRLSMIPFSKNCFRNKLKAVENLSTLDMQLLICFPNNWNNLKEARLFFSVIGIYPSYCLISSAWKRWKGRSPHFTTKSILILENEFTNSTPLLNWTRLWYNLEVRHNIYSSSFTEK